ncbi:MarR family winged helix-turn-helix transcriptional regulator [Amycolatopsis suaedae]|uniref:MarR family transcriptional regulator n=1 Tax=Amycolatopsis suaedae TaxID=2510978 RepID=A0A4Q7J0K2_9PSEU|nr:MarR family transcriptional regulator [Amycolatopsis suaedae]RZQ60258.1 MarR family transcriptional regulator [Amycolatopsis suaedae]
MIDEVERRERRRWQAEDPTWALWEVTRTASDAGRAIARRMGVSYNDVRALEVLSDTGGGLGTVELAERLGIRSASATEMVDRLVAAGHVRRRKHPTDRRRIVVELTEQGWQAAMRALGPMLARFDRVARELGEDAEVVTAYLRAIAAEQRAYCADES